MRYIRAAGIGVCAGLVAGLLWGVAARLAMRIMALLGGRSPELTLEGTVIILIVGTFIGIPMGLLFVAIRKYLPGSGAWKGVVFGLLVLFILGYPFYLGPLRGEAVRGHETLAFVMFEGLLVAFGVAIAVMTRRLEVFITRMAGKRFGTAVSVGTLAVPCSVEALLVALLIVNPFEQG